MQSAISVERALPHNFTTSVTFSHSRTLHVLRARAINAPVPGTGVRPLASVKQLLRIRFLWPLRSESVHRYPEQSFESPGEFQHHYVFSRTNSDSDGSGTFAANPYDFKPGIWPRFQRRAPPIRFDWQLPRALGRQLESFLYRELGTAF